MVSGLDGLGKSKVQVIGLVLVAVGMGEGTGSSGVPVVAAVESLGSFFCILTEKQSYWMDTQSWGSPTVSIGIADNGGIEEYKAITSASDIRFTWWPSSHWEITTRTIIR